MNEHPEPPKGALVVEDDPAIRRLVTIYLQMIGFTVHASPDAESAIEYLQEAVPTLVCLDVTLPVGSGYAVCEYISRHPVLRGTPVLIISARALPQDRALAEELGAADYLIKPFTRAAFVDHVQSLVPAAVQADVR